LKGHGCFKCANGNDLDTFIKKAKTIYGNNKYDYSKVKYFNINTDVTIVCKIHGDFIIKPYHFLYEKNGCIYCSTNTYKDLSFFENDANKIHNFKYKYSIINNLNKNSYINITCPYHGKFKQRIRSHIYDKCGCPICNESKGEKEISIFLDRIKIKYIRQFKFDDCRNINKLPFDFYLPDLNICIEYDGEQHFNSINYFGGNERYEFIKINDSIKNKYCIDNEIKLIRISYKDSICDILDSLKEA
jgi:very-short-patch-repair endonuclease